MTQREWPLRPPSLGRLVLRLIDAKRRIDAHFSMTASCSIGAAALVCDGGEELHFGRAATERLNMTQPPLSRQIQVLEHILDAPLLERTSRSVRLRAGRAQFACPRRGDSKLAESACAGRPAARDGKPDRFQDRASLRPRLRLPRPTASRALPAGLPEVDFSLKEMFRATTEALGRPADRCRPGSGADGTAGACAHAWSPTAAPPRPRGSISGLQPKHFDQGFRRPPFDYFALESRSVQRSAARAVHARHVLRLRAAAQPIPLVLARCAQPRVSIVPAAAAILKMRRCQAPRSLRLNADPGRTVHGVRRD